MTADEFKQYWAPARNRMKLVSGDPPNALTASRKLAATLGLEYNGPNHWAVFELTDELKQKLIWIDSPHYKTILKIIEARKGEHAEINT